MNNRHTITPPPRNVNKLLITAAIIFLLLCLLLSATIGVLYVKKANPQRLLSKLGFSFPPETNRSLESWNSSLEQLDYDSDVVFIGDSLTRGLNFQKRFPGKKIINLGVSGDTLAGISKRTYVIGGLTPEMIFIEGGVNSLNSSGVDDLATLYESMVVQLMADNPGVEIFIQSVLPISNTSQIGGLTNIKIIALNAKLQEIADKHGATI